MAALIVRSNLCAIWERVWQTMYHKPTVAVLHRTGVELRVAFRMVLKWPTNWFDDRYLNLQPRSPAGGSCFQ